ncbi:MAG TPA: ABC transporter ATP-binding protein, partial [Chloroflexota bacterium]|nr:ABC transporter ATP-binding protein [Chloroflexota bacterium]
DEVGRMLGGLQQIKVSLRRMHAVVPAEQAQALLNPSHVSLKDPLPPPLAPHQPEQLETLEVEGLTYRHPSSGQGIVDVSFTLEHGSVTVITGSVGAGKTTLLQVLLGLHPRDRGVIRWNGRRVDDPATFFVPPRSAYTPQVPRLFGETVRENVLLGWPADDAVTREAVHAAVLGRDLEGFENGLETLVGPRGVRLSGGQVQRVAAARMLVREAALLVFDDLSSALDAQTEAELWRRLWQRRRGETFLVVSHRPAVLARADRVLLMDAGRLVDITPGHEPSSLARPLPLSQPT